jgi:hypothetical protein
MTSHFSIARMVFWEDAVWKSLCPEIFQQCDLSKVLEDCKECVQDHEGNAKILFSVTCDYTIFSTKLQCQFTLVEHYYLPH